MNETGQAQKPYCRTIDPIYLKFSAEQIRDRALELGQEIANYYHPREKGLVVIGVLNGACMFASDLVRAMSLARLPRPTDMPLAIRLEFMKLASYGDRMSSSGSVRIELDITQPIEGKDVLVVEDIVDTGHTMHFLTETLRARKPNSIRVCALLVKPERAVVETRIDIIGFSPIAREHFIVGYGMDYRGQYRDLPFLGILGNGKWNTVARESEIAENLPHATSDSAP